MRGFTQNSVANLLFPTEAQQVVDIVAAVTAPRVPATARGSQRRPSPPSRAMTAAAPPLPPPRLPDDEFLRPPPGAVDVLDASTFNDLSGRAQALHLAKMLVDEVGPYVLDPDAPGSAVPAALSERAASAIPVPTDLAANSLVHNHAELLALTEQDVVPHLGALDRAAQDLVKQVGGHCAEQAILVEYLRRHQLAAAGTARALLQRLQHAIGMYEELRQAMDGSLLQKFQDSLGDAFAALQEQDREAAAVPSRARSSQGAAPPLT